MARTKLARSEIVIAATRAFRQRGYAGTSMGHLAEATGLTKGAFYHHFRDKAAVMEACLDATVAFARERVFERVADSSLPVSERVDIMVEGARRLFRKPDEGCFIANTALAGGPDAPRFRERLIAFTDAWRAALGQLAADADLSEPAAFATQTVANIEGAIVLMRIYDDRAYLDAALERFADAVLRLAPKPVVG